MLLSFDRAEKQAFHRCLNDSRSNDSNGSFIVPAGEVARRTEDEHIALIQSIMEKAMRKDALLCELYMQLIKQTTEHPDPNSRVNLRHWAILSLACSVALPPHRNIRKYLMAHLRKCASDYLTEEGKYARFAEKVSFGSMV